MSPLMQQLEATAGFIQSKISAKANTAIILGSGLGNLSSVIEAECSIPYHEIPNFPVSTVEGHKGRLIFGALNLKMPYMLANHNLQHTPKILAKDNQSKDN